MRPRAQVVPVPLAALLPCTAGQQNQVNSQHNSRHSLVMFVRQGAYQGRNMQCRRSLIQGERSPMWYRVMVAPGSRARMSRTSSSLYGSCAMHCSASSFVT